MKKIFTLAAALMMTAGAFAQEATPITKNLDKTMVVYTTDDTEFVKYSDDEEEDVTTYFNDKNVQNTLKKCGLPFAKELTGIKKNIKYTLRNDYKDDATGFEIKKGSYRGLFVDNEIDLGGEVFTDGEFKNLVGFTNCKQLVLYFLPIPNAKFNNIWVYGNPDKGTTYGQGRAQAMYMNADGTQLSNKSARDTKVKTEELYSKQLNPVTTDAIYAPLFSNLEVKADASKPGGYDLAEMTADQPFKIVYNLDNPSNTIPDLKENKKDDYEDLNITADMTEAEVTYYFAKKEDTSAYADHDSANQETPIYSFTGYNLFTDKVGEKSPWSKTTIVRPYIKGYLYLVGYALVAADAAGTEYINTNADGNGDPVMKAFTTEHIAAHGSSATDGIESIYADKAVSNATYNVAGQKVAANYKGIVVKNGVKTVNK